MEVDLSSMSISSQIRLINSAAGIIAIHGAGLGNIFWLQPDALVIEVWERTIKKRQLTHSALRIYVRMRKSVECARVSFRFKQLTPYKLCDCLYYMSGPFQTLAALVGEWPCKCR